METFFEHNPSEAEQRYILGRISKEKYLSAADEDMAHEGIAVLFMLRGNGGKMREYADKLTPSAKRYFYETTELFRATRPNLQ